MSVKITANMMYVKDPESGELIPFSMITSGANQTISQINAASATLSEVYDAATQQMTKVLPAVYG